MSKRESRENSPDLISVIVEEKIMISAIGEEHIMSLREQNRVRESRERVRE